MASHSDPMKTLILGGVAWDTAVYVDAFPGESTTLPNRHFSDAEGIEQVGRPLMRT